MIGFRIGFFYERNIGYEQFLLIFCNFLNFCRCRISPDHKCFTLTNNQNLVHWLHFSFNYFNKTVSYDVYLFGKHSTVRFTSTGNLSTQDSINDLTSMQNILFKLLPTESINQPWIDKFILSMDKRDSEL